MNQLPSASVCCVQRLNNFDRQTKRQPQFSSRTEHCNTVCAVPMCPNRRLFSSTTYSRSSRLSLKATLGPLDPRSGSTVSTVAAQEHQVIEAGVSLLPAQRR